MKEKHGLKQSTLVLLRLILTLYVQEHVDFATRNRPKEFNV